MKKAAYLSRLRLEARHLPKDFAPDGNLRKPAWRGAMWARFDREMSGRPRFPQTATRAACCWSHRWIYFAFRCRYTRLNVYRGEDPALERWELWKRDVAEVFLNPRPARMNRYFEFEVAPNNQWVDLKIRRGATPWHDASWNSGFEHATRLERRRRVWTCEMHIPLAALGVGAIRPPAEWRVNFYRADGRGAGARRRLLAWSPIAEGRSFHFPACFGILRLVR
jgi:Carbohydrate family 9 binding domain-like